MLIDPSEPDRHVQSTYTTLALYTIYSAVVYVSASIHNRPLPTGIAHWIDVVWYTVLISLSSGTNSLFFQFYFFAILVASFRCGTAGEYCAPLTKGSGTNSVVLVGKLEMQDHFGIAFSRG